MSPLKNYRDKIVISRIKNYFPFKLMKNFNEECKVFEMNSWWVQCLFIPKCF